MISKSAKTMIKTFLEDNNVIVQFKANPDKSERFQEWVIPKITIDDLIQWYPLKKADAVQETKVCCYKIFSSFLDIKRLDVYSLIHFVLPIKVIEYLIEKGY